MNERTTASQILAGFTMLISGAFIYGRLLGSRPRLADPGKQWVVTAGFAKLWSMMKTVKRENPNLLLYLAGYMIFDSAMTTFPALSNSYLVVQLQMDGAMVSAVVLLLLVTAALCMPCVVAALRADSNSDSDDGAEAASQDRNGHRPLLLGMLWILVVTLFAPSLLNGPEDKAIAFIFAFLWGIGFIFCEPPLMLPSSIPLLTSVYSPTDCVLC